jgi:shikimate dehydrogenase
LNVTIPLKERIVPMLDALSPQAARAGSVNTVRFVDGSPEGTSTDGDGFLTALRRTGLDIPRTALILGTGGAARSVACALLAEGTTVTVHGRNIARGRRLALDLGARFLPAQPGRLRGSLGEAELLVNATPIGGLADPAHCPLPADAPLHRDLVVFDLVYRPRRTALLDRARAAGCTTVEGIEMLVEQAAGSFEIWTGLPAPVEVMRAAGYRALDRRPPRPVGTAERVG